MSLLDQMADAETVDRLFQTILGRAIGDETFQREHDGTHSVHYWVDRLIRSPEFANNFQHAHGLRRHSNAFIPDAQYRVPTLGPRTAPGLVLVTGPTGSGKSTSLYAFLSTINSVTKRIITIEEPVEYELKGINQIAVRADIGLTFAMGLRHILRQPYQQQEHLLLETALQ